MAGIVDPSMYIIFLKASEIGWVPRPPKIDTSDTGEVIKELSKTSKKVTPEGFLDYLFSTALHERKHFIDMHFSSILWLKFLSWFHATSNIFQIINNLKGKHIKLPLYTKFGNLRDDLPLNTDERANVEKVCNQIFSISYAPILGYIFEVSATITQFVPLSDKYKPENLYEEKNYGYKYYLNFFKTPVRKFKGDYDRAFAFYNFCSWFCFSKKDVEIVKSKFFGKSSDVKSILKKLLIKENFFERKLDEIKRDESYLLYHARNYKKLSHSYVVDLNYILTKLIRFRVNFFSNYEKLVEISSSVDSFIKWVVEDGIKTPFLVDFGYPLSYDQEITGNYKPSRWISPREQFFYYDDNMGIEIFDFAEIDNILWIQHLTNFILNPFFEWANFKSPFTTEEFLEFTFVRN